LHFDIITVTLSDSETKTIVPIENADSKFFLLNVGDHAYYKTFIEEKSANFLSKNLYKISDSLTRALVWRSVTAMIKATKIKSPVLIDYILFNLSKETQTPIIRNMLMIAYG